MSHAFLATSVPEIPIENPTSALAKAGASFVPSPVTATTYPWYFKPVTSKYLSSGELLASTFKCFVILSNTSWFAMQSTSAFFSASYLVVRPPMASLNYLPVMQT